MVKASRACFQSSPRAAPASPALVRAAGGQRCLIGPLLSRNRWDYWPGFASTNVTESAGDTLGDVPSSLSSIPISVPERPG